jgi:16S rRNA (guanine527-N7)-methyltransferase
MNDILSQGAVQLGLRLTDAELESFRRYYDFLEAKNSVMNLTAISGEKDVASLHFLDSLALLPMADFNDKSLIDIGSGAGFPGVPLRLAEQGLRLTLLDAQQKKVEFLRELCAAIGVGDAVCLHARAEEAALTGNLRDSFDFAVSRAVARLNTLSELCLPFVKPDGLFIAMKSVDSDEELREAENAFRKLGAALEAVRDYTIPGTEVTHRAVLVRKKTATPSGYPRRFAKIQKNPL